MAPETKKKIKWAFALVGVALGIFIALMEPPEGLTRPIMCAVGISVWGVFWWATGVIPDYATGLIMCSLFVITEALPFGRAFSGFSSTVLWLCIMAFALGSMASKSGLLKRIALVVLKIFPSTYNGQVWGLIFAGTVACPLIPSTMGKAALSAPLAGAISDQLGLKRGSKGASGLFLACMAGFYLTGSCFLSGAATNYLLLGLVPDTAAPINWLNWFFRAIIFLLVTVLGLGLFITRFIRPETPVDMPKDFIRQELEKLGPMSRDERVILTVMLTTLFLWMTETFHGISSAVVGVLALATLIITGILNRQEFAARISWSALVFTGTLLSMANAVSALKLDTWLGNALTPVLSTVANTPYTLVIALLLSVFFLKFAIVSIVTSAVIIYYTFQGLAISIGVDPWIVCFLSWHGAQVFVFPYMNQTYLAAHFAADSNLIDHAQSLRFSLAFLALNIVAGLVSVVFWKMLGLC